MKLYAKLMAVWKRVDAWVVRCMVAYGVRTLRISLAIVFIWFGTLKLIGRSPVVELVSRTIYWISPEWFVPFLGGWEILVGLGLLFGVAMRLTLVLFWLLLAGTFSVLIVRPDIAFQDGNPLLLTMEGEFVLKNLVLITAGIVVGGTVRRAKSRRSLR